MKLSSEMTHEMAVDRMSMSYSWQNITPEYGNNTIKYSTDGGLNWETITFVNGIYSYTDINDSIHEFMNKKRTC